LKIAASWHSAAGVPLGKETAITLTATAPDPDCPDPRRWKLIAPQAGTRTPLKLSFDEALDPAMLRTALTIQTGIQTVFGAVQVAADAKAWSFTPVGAWQPGPHTIHIDPLLEDLAGNNLQHPFEVDRDQPPNAAQATRLRFDVR
jgi:hypothetical protein